MASRDDGSFEEFVAARGAALLRTARLMCRVPEDAEDVCQAALERAYRNWGRIRAGHDPAPYVRRILLNLVFSRSRRASLLTFVSLGSTPEPVAESRAGALEVRRELIRSLRALPPRQRAVLVLRYWEDLSEVETAEALGCSVGTVKSQASRGLARLRGLVDADLAERG